MEKQSKRWLMSRMKTSGSARRYVANGRYADERHEWKDDNIECLPFRKSIKSTHKFYNGKIRYGLLVRFLRGQIGKDWNAVYSEIIGRIPTRLLDYREMVLWFVATEVERVDGKLWDKTKLRFIWTEELNKGVTSPKDWLSYALYEFYVDPDTNLLQHIQQKTYKKQLAV